MPLKLNQLSDVYFDLTVALLKTLQTEIVVT